MDYTERELNFQFLKNGNFVTNIDLRLNTLILENDKALKGDFFYSKIDSRSDIIIGILDPQDNIKVKMFFKIQNLDSVFPILLMDKEDYLNSIKTSIDNNVSGIRREFI